MIDEQRYRALIQQLATGGIAGNKTYHQVRDQYMPMDSESMGYAYGGGVGSMMQPRQNYAIGGDIEQSDFSDIGLQTITNSGLPEYDDVAFKSGSALDRQINKLNQLEQMGFPQPNLEKLKQMDMKQFQKTGTPLSLSPELYATANNIMSDVSPTSTTSTQSYGRPSMRDITGEDLAVNENVIDRGNPFGDSRISSEELGISGYGRPSMANIAGSSLPSDNVMSVEEIEEQTAANKNKFGLSSLMDFAPFGKKSISGMALKGIGNLFQNIAPRSYGYSTRTYNAMTPGQQALADGLYQPGGLLSGYNKISAFGRGPLGTLSNRLSTIQKTLAKQKVPSKVLQKREQEIKDAINTSINTGEREALSDPSRSVDHGITGGPTRTDIDVADGGSEAGCFIKGTLITMADGTKKPVEQVDLGDEVAVGGKVFAVGRFLNTELYDYKGIKVSGSHMVNEEGDWMRVRDTKHGKSLGNDENTVYVFGSENRRILINDILFTDYFEIEDQEQLLKEEDKFFDNWKTFANDQDKKNVNTLNAS